LHCVVGDDFVESADQALIGAEDDRAEDASLRSFGPVVEAAEPSRRRHTRSPSSTVREYPTKASTERSYCEMLEAARVFIVRTTD